MIDKLDCVSETAHYDKETPKRVHINRIMCKVWGFSYTTIGAILANLARNAGKAGMGKKE